MILKRILPFAHSLLRAAVKEGDIAIDCTAGNGHDTVFLAQLTGPSGKVYSFDIQEQAIQATQQKIAELHLNDRVKVLKQSHSHVSHAIPAEEHGHVAAAIFNLGYLPGGDKSITTSGETTISAINQLFSMMRQNGLIILVIYPGHPEGKNERDQLIQFVAQLDQKKVHVAKYEFLNQKNDPPFVIIMEKQ